MLKHGSITETAAVIRKGGLVAFPTETVYGLGADALNADAVAKIFETKKRPFFDPLIVHVASIQDVSRLASQIDASVYQLAEKFWPGPLTIVLPKTDRVPGIVTAGLGTVGIRMPNHPVALDFIKACGCPVAAPSANRFGCISPTKAEHVRKQLPDVDYVLDGGSATIGIESSVVMLDGRNIRILRHGAISQEEILTAVPGLSLMEGSQSSGVAPGMLKSHYSPEKPMFILGQPLPSDFKKEEAALLSFSGRDTQGYKIVERLTQTHDLREYAANMFSALHRLEESDAQCIVAEPVPETGIGVAIMDRLKKAAYRHSNNIEE